MEFRRLTIVDMEPWAELLAVTFGRHLDEMQALGHWFQLGWEWVAWGGLG